jgi:hypothetical protein
MSEMEDDDVGGLSETDDVPRSHAESASETPPTGECAASPANGDFPREMFLGLSRSGLWPGSALAYLGVTRAALREARARDAQLAADTAKAIAAFEMIHIRILHTKIQEANDWCASAWWLAQRFPKRYGSGRHAHDAEKAVEEVLALLDRSLSAEFNSPAELGRLGEVFERVRSDHGR